MTRQMPTCAKCGQPHWGFQPCAPASASNQAGAAPGPEEEPGRVVFTAAQRARMIRPDLYIRSGYRNEYGRRR